MSVYSAIDHGRAARRTRVLLTGLLVLQSGSRSVRIRDVSREGAHVLGVRGLKRGADVVFQRGAVFAPARISWMKGDEAGLTFYRELVLDEVDGSLPAELLEDR